MAVLSAVLIHSADALPRPVAPQATGSVESLVTQARELTRSYDYEEALALVEQATAIAPLDLDANALLRTLYGRLHGSAQLESRYRNLLAAYPEDATAYYLLARSMRSTTQREMYLRMALQLDPDYGPAATALAGELRDDDQRATAQELYRRALTTMPGDYDVSSRYADFLYREDRTVEAIAFLEQMAAQYPQELRFLLDLWSMKRRADPDSMDRLLPRIRAQRHRFMGSLEHMAMFARALQYSGPIEANLEASEVWLQIAERYPDHPRAELALLDALSLAPEVERKLEVLDVLEGRYPGSPVRYAAYYGILRSLISSERHEEAIAIAQSLVSRPDPGYDRTGVGRDDRVEGMAAYGTSLECVGYAAWFAASQEAVARTTGRAVDWRGGRQIFGPLDDQTVVTPEAATAARGLAASGCESAIVHMAVGQYLAHNSSFRTLGIELLERAISLHRESDASGGPPNPPPMYGYAESYRELLPYFYLRDGRLEEALARVDTLITEGTTRSPRFYRIAGEVYETAGRLDDARRVYLRGLSSPPDREFVRAALDRLYDASGSTEIIVFGPDDRPRIAAPATRVRRVALGIDAPLHRFLGDELTLLVVWFARMDHGRELAAALPRLEALVGNDELATLPIAVDERTSNAARAVSALAAFQDDASRGVAMTWDGLEEWGIDALPITLLIDGEGRILAQQMSYDVGLADWLRDWRDVIGKNLEQAQ